MTKPRFKVGDNVDIAHGLWKFKGTILRVKKRLVPDVERTRRYDAMFKCPRDFPYKPAIGVYLEGEFGDSEMELT